MADEAQLQPLSSRRSPRCPPLTQRRATTEGREERGDGAEICKMGGEFRMLIEGFRMEQADDEGD